MMRSLHIALVQTGGTISGNSDGDVLTVPRGDSAVSARFGTLCRDSGVTYETFTPVSVFSEDITGGSLMRILKTLIGVLGKNFDGVIITHGSDTVHFTAAAVAALFPRPDISVCFTCSLIPADCRDTDAVDNLFLALRAVKRRMRGVWLAFKNRESGVLIDGSRVSPCTVRGEFCDYFGTPSYVFSKGRFCAGSVFARGHVPAALNLPNKFSDILFVRPYMLMNYKNFNIERCDAVLHAGYHSGTACTSGEGEESSVIGLIGRCRLAGIPFYFCLPERSEKSYPSTAKILRSGAIPLFGVSPYFAYMRLVLGERPFVAPPVESVSEN